MILVDTGAWFGLTIPWDVNHAAATEWVNQNNERLLTTDYVLDEILTLLVRRRQKPVSVALGDRIVRGIDANLVRVEPQDVDQAWRFFVQFHDKNWSFTDCTSYVVMQRLNIKTAFSFDHHFKQFGTVAVVP